MGKETGEEMRGYHMAILVILLAGARAFPSTGPLEDAASFLQTGVMTSSIGLGSLNVTALTIDAGPARESAMVLGDADSAFTVRMTSDGHFKLDHRGLSGFIVGPDGDVTVQGKMIAAGDVQIGSDLGGSFIFKELSQWLLHIDDSQFNSGGWTNQTTSQCGGSAVPILGGYGKFAGGSATRNYRQLPDHSEIRIKANWHFIDNWAGEMGFLKLDHQLVWTDSHDSQIANTNAINLCGAPTHEGKFAVPIDVVIPHTATSIAVTFGSNMAHKSPPEASWGISALEIYIR